MNNDATLAETAPPLTPRHIAIIMDGNGRWAERRGLPRVAGHKNGVETVRNIVEAAVEAKIKAITLFAFSSENWRRPETEVGLLFDLLLTALRQEIKKLVKNNVRLRFIGDLEAFSGKMKKSLEEAQLATAQNTGLNLVIALNYGGRWEIVEAARALMVEAREGRTDPNQLDEAMFASHLTLPDLPEPDLFIRTSGEIRISNFLLWHLAYTELYFTEVFWPDFNKEEFNKALEWYKTRQRRFGYTGKQLAKESNA